MACLSAIIGPLVAGEPNATELPAMMGVEKVAVTGAQMIGAAGAGAAAQYHLVAHELAVVFAHGPMGRLEARVGQVGAGGPFPDIAEQMGKAGVAGSTGLKRAIIGRGIREGAGDRLAEGRVFPFLFCRQAFARPACVGLSLIHI